MTESAQFECDPLSKYPAIAKARQQSQEKLEVLRKLAGGLVSSDASIVAYGSLARGEWTSGSDIDWTLLVDGQADPQHKTVADEFRSKLREKGFQEPGPTGVFGSLVFSHELVHCIGGENDSTTNMTRRLLLLLESVSLSEVDAHQRIIRLILDRYIDAERSFLTQDGRKYKVPRFLLNDIVRYWRTVAVRLR